MSQAHDLDQVAINTIRTLAMDAVQAANSGHPGAPMGLAPVAYCLWQRFLRFDPDQPIWPNRDRFVLSVGHASMLLYALLHLTGVKAVNPEYETLGEPSVTLDAIKRFRQLDSPCAGHPEYRWTTGVETTTGPLGQGVATSVGMAIAQRWLAATYNRPGFDLFDYDVYALAGDGCMMEGISGEAASLAGHLKLSNLCWIYDDNKITIEGSTEPRLQRGRRPALRGLRLERPARRRRQRPRRARPRVPAVPRDQRPADADHRAQPHRLRLAEQAGHLRGARQPARRGGGAADQAVLRLAGGREVPGAGRGRRAASATASASAAMSCAPPGTSGSRRTRRSIPTSPTRSDRMQRRLLPEGWDQDLPSFPADEKGLAGRIASGQGAERDRAAGALADRRRGRPRAVDQHPPDLRGRRRLQRRELCRPQLPLRRARARHERRAERHVAVQDPRLRLGLPDLQRLRPAGDPAQRADGDPDDPHLHARLRSASARTARRISRWSSSPRCGRSRG